MVDVGRQSVPRRKAERQPPSLKKLLPLIPPSRTGRVVREAITGEVHEEQMRRHIVSTQEVEDNKAVRVLVVAGIPAEETMDSEPPLRRVESPHDLLTAHWRRSRPRRAELWHVRLRFDKHPLIPCFGNRVPRRLPTSRRPHLSPRLSRCRVFDAIKELNTSVLPIPLRSWDEVKPPHVPGRDSDSLGDLLIQHTPPVPEISPQVNFAAISPTLHAAQSRTAPQAEVASSNLAGRMA